MRQKAKKWGEKNQTNKTADVTEGISKKTLSWADQILQGKTANNQWISEVLTLVTTQKPN